MSKYCVLGFMFLYFQLTTTHPFIFESDLNTCSYNFSLKKQSALVLTRKLQKAEDTDIVIYFTLCGYLPPQINCGSNVAACLKEKNSDSRYVLGKKIIPGISDLGGIKNVSFTDGAELCKFKKSQKYKFSIEFDCEEGVEEIRVKKKNECEYKIYMTDPKCLLSCTTKIDEQLVDLKGIKGNYFVESNKINFSISLCGAESKCLEYHNSNVSICAKYNGSVIPLSTPQNEKILYNHQKNEMVYRGSYKGENGTKKFEMLLKCSWEDDVGQITHKELHIQGKEYKFVMETSYGCVKLPPNCEIYDGPLFYNLTSLFNINGYHVLNVSTGDIYLNLCGPLTFKTESENSCSKSFSQVCELSKGVYVNRGSIMSKPEVLNDVVKVTYSNGMKCKKDPSKQYNTHIELFCSKTDDGPSFVMANDCDLFINWKTPIACPKYDQKSCDYEQKEHNDCSVTYQGQYYDFSNLKPFNKKHEVVDPRNSNIKYFLNICDPVIDSEAPCMKSSAVIMKDINVENVKYRTKSLGKRNSINIINDEIVTEAMGGTYCGTEGDYRSEIHLVCGVENETPLLVNHTECSFIFQWKTPYACLDHTRIDSKHCLLKDPSSGVSLDFAKSHKKSFRIDINRVLYLFDICQDNYTECSPNGQCESIPVTKTLSSNSSSNVLEIFLPKICDAENVINKVRFELVCSEFKNNEYFRQPENKIISNCTVKLQFYTDIVCSRKEYQIEAKEQDKYSVLHENVSSNQDNENCSVLSPSTGYKIYLSSLSLDIPMVSCPTTLFYDHNNTVILIYPSTRICDKSNKGDPYVYKTALQCSSRESREVKKMDCLELHKITGPDFCEMFQHPKMNKSKKYYTLEIVLGLFGIVLCLCVSIFFRYKWKKCLRRSAYLTVYEKDADI